MKTLILCITVIISLNTFSKEKNTVAWLPTLNTIKQFGEIKKLNSKDKEKLQSILKNVLIIEEKDPSSAASLALSESYKNNKDLYEEVLSRFSKKDQLTLKSLYIIMDEPADQ